jgi:hypothetical protein
VVYFGSAIGLVLLFVFFDEIVKGKVSHFENE